VSLPGCLSVAVALCLAASNPAFTQTPATPSVSLGGTLQADYERVTVDAATRDRAFFRRLLLAVHIVATEDWTGEIQIDAAQSVLGDRLLVRDAYVRYVGLADRGLTITVGNQKMPFSRSALAPSGRRGLIERPVPGERPFGAPGRAIAVQMEGRHEEQRLLWAAALASALHGPDVLEIRVDGLADSRETWNDGILGAGRFEWHPLGPTR
jgi:phosphate-selective porin